MKLFITFIIIMWVMFLVSISKVHAETSDAELHDAAHAGATYAITHVGEVTCTHLTSHSKLVCTIVSASIANLINVGYKASESFPSDTKRAIVAGVIGSGVAGIVITLDF